MLSFRVNFKKGKELGRIGFKVFQQLVNNLIEM